MIAFITDECEQVAGTFEIKKVEVQQLKVRYAYITT